MIFWRHTSSGPGYVQNDKGLMHIKKAPERRRRWIIDYVSWSSAAAKVTTI